MDSLWSVTTLSGPGALCVLETLSFIQARLLPSLSALPTLPSPSQVKPHRQIWDRMAGVGWGGQTSRCKFFRGTTPGGVSGWSGPHQGLSLINSHTLAKGVDNGHRAAQQAERETLLSLSRGSVWSRGRPKRDGSGERGGDQRMPQPPITSSSVSRIPHYLSFSFLSPIPPPSFSVSSDQIEQLHRRFKQLSGDQPTIR